MNHQPSSINNPVLTDVELLNKKNAELTHLRLQRAGMMIVIILLALVLGAIAIISRLNPPSAEPTIDIIKREAFDDFGSTIRIPATYQPGQVRPIITAGEAFTYNTKGKKLVDAAAIINYQLTCQVHGVDQLTSLGSVFSNITKGDFDTTRSFTIPVSTRLEDSDECRLQIIAAYTFYQTDKVGNTSPIEIKEIGLSNYFRLRIPQAETSQRGASNTVAQAAPEVAPVPKQETSGTPPTDPPQQTNIPKDPAPEASRPTLPQRIPEPIKNLLNPARTTKLYNAAQGVKAASLRCFISPDAIKPLPRHSPAENGCV